MRCRIVLGSSVRVGLAEEDVARLVRGQIGFSFEFVSTRRADLDRASIHLGFQGFGWLWLLRTV